MRFFSLLIVSLLAVRGVWGLTVSLTNDNDAGAGSLRQAILDINGTGNAANVIKCTAAFSVKLDTPLPTLSFGTTFQQVPFDISGQLDFNVNPVVLTFLQSDTSTFSGNIKETAAGASVVKEGGNELTLKGENTYSVGTTINEGSVVISDDKNLGSVNGPVTFGGGTLDIQMSEYKPARVFTFTGPGTFKVESGETTIGTNLLGTGLCTKLGSGTLILTGLGGGFTGGFMVSVGTLQGDAAAFFHNNIINETRVVFNQTIDGTYGGNMSGVTGILIKEGAGTLFLTGTNTYGGGTTVSEGAIQGSSTSIQGDITNNAVVVFDEPVAGPYGGVMSGNGSVIKTGAGVLTMSGANTYSGGTTIAAGTLQGTTTSLQGNIVNNGALIFNQDTSGSYTGAISGVGTVTKLGLGSVFLGGTNTYSGGTTVTAGELGGTTSSLQGAILNNASLLFSQQFDGTYSGTLTGTGTLTKNEAGRVTTTGSLTQGATTVSNGVLYINGTLASPTVTVDVAGELGGSGTIIGGVTNRGQVSPGDGGGTLSIVGSYLHENSATLNAHIAPSFADLLTMTGTATLNGGDTTVIPLNEHTRFLPLTTYTILHADGGVVGTFSALTIGTPSPLFSASYTFLPNDVQITVTVLPFSAVVTRGNPGVMAKYLDLFDPPIGSDLDFVFSQLQLLGLSDLEEAINSLQPANYKNVIIAQQRNMLGMVSGITSRLEELYKTDCSQENNHRCGFSVWTDSFGDFFSMRGEKFFNGFEGRSYAIELGGDYTVASLLSVGLHGGYTYSDLNFNKSVGSSLINSYYGGLYGGWHACRWFVNAAGLFSKSDIEAKRSMRFGELHRQAETEHEVLSAMGHVDGGFLVLFEELALRPFGAYDYLWSRQEGFDEDHAKSLNLKVEETTYHMHRFEGGLKVANCFQAGECVEVIPDFKISYVHECRLGDDHYTARFKGAVDAFTVKTLDPDVHFLALGFGVTTVLNEGRASFTFRYDGEFGSGIHDNRAQLSCIYHF